MDWLFGMVRTNIKTYTTYCVTREVKAESVSHKKRKRLFHPSLQIIESMMMRTMITNDNDKNNSKHVFFHTKRNHFRKLYCYYTLLIKDRKKY